MKILSILIFWISFVVGCNCNDELNGGHILNCGTFNIFLGNSHQSGCCNSANDPHKFEAKEKGREDNNISTGKIRGEKNITIYTDREFSGKVWSVIKEKDNNISEINESLWNEEEEKNITLITKEVTRDSYIYIKWDDNSSENDDGEANSTDHFAIIPLKYIIDIPSTIVAGKEYEIEINATDEEEKNVSYNQSFDGSKEKNATIVYIHKDKKEEDNRSISLEFKGGINSETDFNISDIGEYRLEINDTEYGAIDKDDTEEKERIIYGSKEIKVIPYKFVIVIDKDKTKTSTGEEWLYQGKEFNYTIKAKIQAYNKKGEILERFDKDEYATDVNSSLKYEIVLIDEKDEVNMSIIKMYNSKEDKTEEKVQSKEYEIKYTIDDSNFTKGESEIFGMVTYIKKDITTPSSPIDMNIIEVNTTEVGVINEGKKVDDNISYLYPKVDTNDIITTQKESDTRVNIIVYDKSKTDAQSRLGDNVLIDWYINKLDNSSNFIDKQMKKRFSMDSEDIDINVSTTLNNGLINLEVDNNLTPKVDVGVIHLNTKTYLWYSKYKEVYSYSNDSSCVNHYCIEYNYRGLKKKIIEVGSGVFDGSEVNNTLENNTSRHGVKIYR